MTSRQAKRKAHRVTVQLLNEYILERITHEDAWGDGRHTLYALREIRDEHEKKADAL